MHLASFHQEYTEEKLFKTRKEIFTMELRCSVNLFLPALYAFILHLLVCVSICMWVCAHSVRMDVTGQVAGVYSLLLLFGSW